MEETNKENLNLGNKNNRTSFMKEHKIMSFIIASTIILIGVNGFMLYEFVNIFNTL